MIHIGPLKYQKKCYNSLTEFKDVRDPYKQCRILEQEYISSHDVTAFNIYSWNASSPYIITKKPEGLSHFVHQGKLLKETYADICHLHWVSKRPCLMFPNMTSDPVIKGQHNVTGIYKEILQRSPLKGIYKKAS